jgi:rsbT antagonist protein RsbS
LETRVPILRIGRTLIVPLQVELHDRAVEEFQEEVLGEIARVNAVAVVIDISKLDVVDSYVARVITETGQMARLMGAGAVLVGMRPEVAATLIRMRHPMQGIKTALDLEQGLALVEREHGAGRGAIGS